MPRFPRLIRLALALPLALLPVTAQAADGVAGPYLAARHASIFSDYGTAAEYFARALVRDPSNPHLLENATLAYLGLGDIDKAAQVARRSRSLGVDSQIAHLALISADLKRGAYAQVIEDIEAGEQVGPLVDGLVTAWATLAAGNVGASLDLFDEIINAQGLDGFGSYHKALALASVGDYESAAEVFARRDGIAYQGSRRAIIAYAQILSQLEQNDVAADLLSDMFGSDPDPAIVVMLEALRAGDTLDYTLVTTADEGLAEVFFSVATALNSEAADSYTLLYSRVAEYLSPDHIDAILLSADLLEALDRYALAVETYNRVPRDDPAFHAAEIGRAEALRSAGETELAVEVLRQLARDYSHMPRVHVTLGNTLRQLERFDEATEAYDRAVALYESPSRDQWLTYFARGITHEREDRWPLAEKDFRVALELNPGQPQVLNYLGYSYVEQRVNLDEALAMIEEAVAARPDSGYITDSLGWVLYRLGRYDEAVVHMERAAELEPVDPIVNDHLGDVYWAVGRQLEAEFQWRRALSFEPTEEDAERIRRKLEVGLDAVLEEEGADPIAVANDG